MDYPPEFDKDLREFALDRAKQDLMQSPTKGEVEMKKWTWIIITPDGSISGTNDEDTARDMNEEAAVLTTQDDGSIVQLDSDFDPQEIPEI